MGLDMYLYKKTYVRNWEHTPIEERHEVRVTRGGQPVDARHIDPAQVSYIVESIGYWRKANAIHRWFVEQVQGGVDDCRSYFVSRAQLEALLETVSRVLESSELVDGQVTTGYRAQDGQMTAMVEPGKVVKDPQVARQLLPTQEGFFFGGTDYDEWYHQQLVDTKRIVSAALADPEADEFEYVSSW